MEYEHETRCLATILATVRNDLDPHMGSQFVGVDRFGMVANRSLHETIETVFGKRLTRAIDAVAAEAGKRDESSIQPS